MRFWVVGVLLSLFVWGGVCSLLCVYFVACFFFNAQILNSLHCCHSICFCGLQIQVCCAFYQQVHFPRVYLGAVSPCMLSSPSLYSVWNGGIYRFFCRSSVFRGRTLQGNLRNDAKMVAVTRPSVSYVLTYGCNLQSKTHRWLHLPGSHGS